VEATIATFRDDIQILSPVGHEVNEIPNEFRSLLFMGGAALQRCDKGPPIDLAMAFPKRHTVAKNRAREGHDFSRAVLVCEESGFSR